MSRALLLVLDSFGIGSSADAGEDEGADTLGHVAAACARGEAEEGRAGPLCLPHLERLGLGAAARASGGSPAALDRPPPYEGAWGYAVERSPGKDTPSGHWEMAGLPLDFAFATFPQGPPSFPAELVEPLVRRAGLPGILGNRAASGTEIMAELGAEHVATGKPILYTSADSVLQIAAHEEAFGLERLWEVCRIARDLADAWHVGRVIARPFVGEPGTFRRTVNRRDFTTPPPGPTLLDRLVEAGGRVFAVGKIADIFAHRAITRAWKGGRNETVFDETLEALRCAGDGTLVFSNFVDFDSHYGHRRDAAGYARALEAFDRRVPEIEALLGPDDLAVLTADHGCDPTWRGTDHTREHVPVLAFGEGVGGRDLGRRETFADVGQSIAHHLGLPPLAHGTSFA